MDRLPLVVQIIQDILGKEYIAMRFEDIDGEKKQRLKRRLQGSALLKLFTDFIQLRVTLRVWYQSLLYI